MGVLPRNAQGRRAALQCAVPRVGASAFATTMVACARVFSADAGAAFRRLPVVIDPVALGLHTAPPLPPHRHRAPAPPRRPPPAPRRPAAPPRGRRPRAGMATTSCRLATI